jgi:hypothetical protein
VAAVKNGLWSDTINVYQAAGAGVALSATVVFHKKIFSSFRTIGNAICSVPKQIQDSFLLYYVKESAKQQIREASLFLHQQKSALSQTIGSTVLTTKVRLSLTADMTRRVREEFGNKIVNFRAPKERKAKRTKDASRNELN